MQGASLDYYKVLGVSKTASFDEIKRRYRELSKKYHPDTPTGDEKLMAHINEAYATLSDPVKRHFYKTSEETVATNPGPQRARTTPKPVVEVEENSPSGWFVFLTYALVIPVAIFLVSILTPVANRLFSQDQTAVKPTTTTTTDAAGSESTEPTGAVTKSIDTTPTITEPTTQTQTTIEPLPDSQTTTTTDGQQNTSDTTSGSQTTTTQNNSSRNLWGYGLRTYKSTR